MAREITSKSIDGITDLVVIAPIREGFINAYENVTYATRLRIVAEALNRIRISAREHEFTVPFSDVTERILTLLDFRIGVLDKDLFALHDTDPREDHHAFELQSRRYLYLTATFDTAWEPYMRLIWDPLGPFLDLIFCNCEGYVTAGDHSCEDFIAWVRANQMDSAIFYATSGATIADDIYHGKIDRLLREASRPDRELDLLRAKMPDPEVQAGLVRAGALQAMLNPPAGTPADFTPLFRIHELALEVVTVLYRLADFYPPEWLFDKKVPETWRDGAPVEAADLQLTEGKYLARVAHSVLKGWNGAIPPEVIALSPEIARFAAVLEQSYREPLEWYRKAALAAPGKAAPNAVDRPLREDPPFAASEVQAGILTPAGTPQRPVTEGALLLFSVSAIDPGRAFLRSLEVSFEGDAPAANGLLRTVSVTYEGLRRLGVPHHVMRGFAKEFREGMEARAGQIGDLRENHPRRWALPRRNWPRGGAPRPPIELAEIDIVVQLRHAPAPGAAPGALEAEIARLAAAAQGFGVALLGTETMNRVPRASGGAGDFTDHFGFADGVSQPEIQTAPVDELFARGPDGPVWNNKARLGEVLLGYGNDRFDSAPDWQNGTLRRLLHGGSFLVVRKLGQNVAAFRQTMADQAARLNAEGIAITADELAWQVVGRKADGKPLIGGAQGDNGFDYTGDPDGRQCPHAAHVRRANPRDFVHGRPAPRILRRGMSYGPPAGAQEDPAQAGERGLIFQCYQSSIAEQFEVIQRWINGGNSTGVASAQNDPLLGVGPKAAADDYGRDRGQPRLFQFEWQGKVARIEMAEPFVALKWGLYLFTPSRAGLAELGRERSEHEIRDYSVDFDELLETEGRRHISKLEGLTQKQFSHEWKRLLEDIDVKDPGEKSLTPNVWSAIRWYKGGAYRLEREVFLQRSRTDGGLKGNPPPEEVAEAEIAYGAPDDVLKPTVVVAGRRQVLDVLADWKRYSVEEQLSRIEHTSGSIYVAQQPDDHYPNCPELNGKYNYRAESEATNAILMAYGEEQAFLLGRAAGASILATARGLASRVPVSPPLDYFKLELRRQYLMPALGAVCNGWFGIPALPLGEDPHGLRAVMAAGGWDWNVATKDDGTPGRTARAPGDCLSPSRHAFYPRPTDSIRRYAEDHGPAIRNAGKLFVEKFFGPGKPEVPGAISRAMFAAIGDQDVLARNLIGIMVGAIPPMDGNLRGILAEWLNEKALSRHQAAYQRARDSGLEPYAAARQALWVPMTRAMCKRPAPDLLYRTAMKDGTIDGRGDQDTAVKKGDTVVVSLVGAAQQSLFHNPEGEGDVSVIFGGNRKCPYAGAYGPAGADGEEKLPELPVHACPAQAMAMGAMLGILTALLEAGRIQALPASLIVKIRDWPPLPT